MRINKFNFLAIGFLVIAYLFKESNRVYYIFGLDIKSCSISKLLLVIAFICITIATIDFIIKLLVFKKKNT